MRWKDMDFVIGTGGRRRYPPLPEAERNRLIDDHLARNGVTRCPTMYALGLGRGVSNLTELILSD